MKIISLITLILLATPFINSCGHAKNDKQEFGDYQLLVESVDKLSGSDLEAILGYEVRKKLREQYSGQYKYYLQDDTTKILHGQFSFSYADSISYYSSDIYTGNEDVYSVSKVKYTGFFKNNSIEGKFTEEFLFNDRIDLFSKWTITLDIENNKCISSTFTGAIGHIMPITTYHYYNLDTCSFDKVMTLSWENWRKEYSKSKNAR